MLNRLLSCGAVSVRERPKFIGMLLAKLILKRVGIHGIKTKAIFGSFGFQRFRVCLVPRYMQRDSRRCGSQLVNNSAIIKLIEYVAWFAAPRKTRKPCAACANTPRRNGNAESGDFGFDRINGNTTPIKPFAKTFVVTLECWFKSCVFSTDHIIGNHIRPPSAREGLGIARIHIEEIAG